MYMNLFKRFAAALIVLISADVYAGEPFAAISGIWDKMPFAGTTEFSLEKDFSIVVSPDDAVAQAFAAKLQLFLEMRGITAFGFSNFAAARNITASTVDSVKGGGTYSICVGKNLVTVNFTSPAAMNEAYTALIAGYTDKTGFFKRLTRKNNRRFVKADEVPSKAPVTADRADVVDLMSQSVDCETVKARLHKASTAGVTTVYMVFMNDKGWKINSSAMSLVNPDAAAPAGHCYSYSQVRDIKNTADNLGMKIVPVIDIATAENPAFEGFTGHPVHSTEGVRFTRAMVREFCLNTGFGTVCLGDDPDDETVARRFIEPVVAEIEHAGGTAVML